METRKLGKSLSVSTLGLGCMGMSEFYGAGDDTAIA
jgi:aryl-alcohol dehydrogenase-like predicted oxidoreductase